ncbi:deoxyribose-phosphate aldolase [Marinivivus vitaminiproducens]|uniref:deoxyribose-phosphate aldolase n=1 Tax=Marinivivus vitaminiproducens TaxID=3035935 RepID=UPI0027993BDF|nr:deoxyribose-phosphate aldolase [Geminicoccaceae bacterium SCSIO 64248]
MVTREQALALIATLDLTDLSETMTEEDAHRLCDLARSPAGPVAAVCLWPRFVPAAKAHLAGSGIAVATVVNFPDGRDDPPAVRDALERVLADGADEIDLVMPYAAVRTGDRRSAESLLADARATVPGTTPLKVILESGALDGASLRLAGEIALDAGADFLKTSTGKIATGATPEAAEIMLATIADRGNRAGFKASGGVRRPEGALAFYEQASRWMRGAPDAARFRIGASGLLTALVPLAMTERPGGA